MHRRQFLLATGSALLATAAPAVAAHADGPADDHTSLLLVVAAELLTLDFYERALASGTLGPRLRKAFARARFNEQEHYDFIASQLGPTASKPGDFGFAYPDGTFSSAAGALGAAEQIETTVLGAYLGAVPGLASPVLRSAFARIAASEAEHLSAISGARRGRPVGVSFPAPLDVQQATDRLEPFFA